MDLLKIKGGTPLCGEIVVGGAKNACLPLFAACLLTDETCVLENVPDLSDIRFMVKLLENLGATVNIIKPNTWEITAKKISHKAPYELVRKMRASVCLLGPLVSRLRKAEVSLPGGCVIGQRPIDLHLKGLERLGCSVRIENGYVKIDAEKAKGNDVFLGGRYGSTVTGTANILMAAVLLEGKTRIDSAACEPEIEALCQFLIKMGAEIEGVGSHTLIVHGGKKLKGCRFRVIGDRIEAGTFIIGGLMNKKSHVRIKGADPNHLRSLLHLLDRTNVQIIGEEEIEVFGGIEGLESQEVATLPYPGFPTDLQAQLTTLFTLVPGINIITERIYPNRFMHVPELLRMGAQISVEGPSAIIHGTEVLMGAPVMASDLRASVALVLAGLIAKGETLIQRVYHIDRGYENIDKKLKNLGAYVERLSGDEVIPMELAS